MRAVASPRRSSTTRPGRVVPKAAARLKSRCVRLAPGGTMGWHSTGSREELLVPLAGTITVEYELAGRARRRTLAGGACLFIPRAIRHRVLNGSRTPVRYLYVTG